MATIHMLFIKKLGIVLIPVGSYQPTRSNMSAVIVIIRTDTHIELRTFLSFRYAKYIAVFILEVFCHDFSIIYIL